MKRILLSLIAFVGLFANAFALDGIPAWENDVTPTEGGQSFYLYSVNSQNKDYFLAHTNNKVVAAENATMFTFDSNTRLVTEGLYTKLTTNDVTFEKNPPGSAVGVNQGKFRFVKVDSYYNVGLSGQVPFVGTTYWIKNTSGTDLANPIASQGDSKWYCISETQYKNHMAYKAYYDALNIDASKASKAWRDKYLKFEHYNEFVEDISKNTDYITELEDLTKEALKEGGWNKNPEKYALFDEGEDYGDYSFNKEGMKEVEVHRTFYCGEWNTFCLPFNIEKENLCDDDIKIVKKLSSVDTSDGGYYLHFGDTEDIIGGVSYIVWVEGEKNTTVEKVFHGDGMNLTKSNPESVDGVKFQGVYSKGTVPAHSYILNGNKFYHVAEGVTVNISGFRGYFVMPTDVVPQGALNASFDDDDVTGINFVNENEYENENMFNIAGQRVNANAKGIIIKNGKKYLVK